MAALLAVDAEALKDTEFSPVVLAALTAGGWAVFAPLTVEAASDGATVGAREALALLVVGTEIWISSIDERWLALDAAAGGARVEECPRTVDDLVDEGAAVVVTVVLAVLCTVLESA